MNILFLSLYFKPDLCAGSFRNTVLLEEVKKLLSKDDRIDIITSLPNRYASFSVEANEIEVSENCTIYRVKMPKHTNGMIDQIRSYSVYFRKAISLTKGKKYDLVYASSSRLFTAVLGSLLSRKKHCPLYLDIRDIFSDSMRDYFNDKPFIKYPGLFTVLQFEKFAFNRATHINLVSKGFASYFNKMYPKPNYSYFTNGIDDIFLENADKAQQNSQPTPPYIITYAGNIGSGQDLESMIPELAKKLGDKYKFIIIGDGGTKNILEERINLLHLKNVEIIKPVSRNELLVYYNKTDFFFTKLNILEKVALPSKVFEYGAYNKPIICAFSGFAHEFVENEVPNIILAEANDVDGLAERILSYNYKLEDRMNFKNKFARVNIMKEMARSILSIIQ